MTEKLILYTLYLIISSADFKFIMTVFLTSITILSVLLHSWKRVAEKIEGKG